MQRRAKSRVFQQRLSELAALRRRIKSDLEDQLQSNLDVPRQVVLAGRLSEVRVGRIGVRIRELRVVESIQKFSARLKLYFLGNRDVLDQREVPQVQRLTAEPAQARREGADVIRQPDPRVGALLHWIVYSIGLHCRVVEIETLRIESGVDRAPLY